MTEQNAPEEQKAYESLADLIAAHSGKAITNTPYKVRLSSGHPWRYVTSTSPAAALAAVAKLQGAEVARVSPREVMDAAVAALGKGSPPLPFPSEEDAE